MLTERTAAVVTMIASLYEVAPAGGNLHCELDDWNIDDEFFEGEFSPYNKDVPATQLALERELFEALKAMTLAERASALALHDGFFPIEAAINAGHSRL